MSRGSGRGRSVFDDSDDELESLKGKSWSKVSCAYIVVVLAWTEADVFG